MEVLTPLCSPMNLRPGPVFDFTLTRTPEEMALYDRFGEAYQQRVETFSPCSQLHLKRLIAYEVPNHPRVMFRNHGDVEGLMACSEVDLPPTPGISSQIGTPKSPGRITPRSLKPSENSRLLSSPKVPPAWGKGSSKKVAGTIPPNVLLNVKPMAMLSAIKNRKVVKKLRFDTGANQIRKISKSYSDCLEQLGCPDPAFQPTLPQQPLSSSKLTSHSYRRLRKVRRISKSLADLSRFSDNTIMSVTDSNNNSANYDNRQSRHDGPPDDAGPAKERGMIKRSMRSRIPRLKPNFMEGLKKIAVDDRNH